jgi:hypothetical protein
MKNSKNLLTEILRVQELMGVKQLISEEGGKFDPVVEFFKSMLKISAKDVKFTKMFDEAFEHIKYRNSELFEKLKKSLNSTEISVNGLKGLRNLSSIKSSELKAMLEELQSEMISYVFTKYTDDFIELGDDIIEASLVGKPQAKRVYDFMVDLAEKGQAEELQIAIQKQRGNFPSYVLDHIQNTKFIQKAEDAVVDTIGKTGDEIVDDVSDEMIDQIIDAGDKSLSRVKEFFGSAWAKIVYGWDKIGDWTLLLRKYSGLNGPLEGVFTSFPFKQVANAPGLSIIAKKMHLTYDKLMVDPIQIKKDLDEIFKRILVKLESGTNTDITNEQLELTAKFSQFLAKRNESHKIIFDEWMILWKEDDRLKRLFNPTQKRPTGQLDANKNPIFYDVPEPLYFKNGWSDPKFIQMMEAFETAKGNNVGAIKQTYNKIYGSIQLAKNLIKIIPHRRPTIKNFMNYGANVLELIQRLIGALVVYTPNTYKEVAHNVRVLGKGRWFGVGLGQKIVMSTIDIPLILASYRTIGSFIQDYVNSRRLAQTKPGQPLPKEMKWWLLSDEEWSIMTSGPDGDAFKTTISFFGESFKKFSITNTKELTNSVLPWTIAGWAYFEKFKGDWKVSDFYDQFNSVESNSKENLNKVNTEAVKDTNLNKIVKDNNIQTYEETSNKIDTALKTRPKLVPTEEANY